LNQRINISAIQQIADITTTDKPIICFESQSRPPAQDNQEREIASETDSDLDHYLRRPFLLCLTSRSHPAPSSHDNHMHLIPRSTIGILCCISRPSHTQADPSPLDASLRQSTYLPANLERSAYEFLQIFESTIPSHLFFITETV